MKQYEIRRGMNRVGLVLAVVAFVGGAILSEGKFPGAALLGLVVWVVVSAVGWAIAGFLAE